MPNAQNVGWTLKGVPHEVIALVRSAAQHRGMGIGSWVSRALREAAERDLADSNLPAAEKILARLDVIEEVLKSDIRGVGLQLDNLHTEFGIIRRGLLPLLCRDQE